MPNKLTIEFVKSKFEEEGYTLLTKEYVNNTQQLEYVCPKNHQGSMMWLNWRQGHRCKVCGTISMADKRRLSIDFIKEQFKKEGYVLLTEKYVNAQKKLLCICPKGHIWRVRWGDWQHGHRCFTCFGSAKFSIDFVREQFKKENYILLTKKYTNANGKLEYICPKGHKNKTDWHHWQQGKRCKQCYFENNRGTNHYNWNKDLTDKDRVSRHLTAGCREWAYVVKEKDNFTCQICGDDKGGNLVSHHLESYNSSPGLRTALDNGVCLCEKCHKGFHRQYGYGNNTRKQFEEFVNSYNKQVMQTNVR